MIITFAIIIMIFIIIIIRKRYIVSIVSYSIDAHFDNCNKIVSSLRERILGDKYRLLLPLINFCCLCHYIIITLVYICNFYFCLYLQLLLILLLLGAIRCPYHYCYRL